MISVINPATIYVSSRLCSWVTERKLLTGEETKTKRLGRIYGRKGKERLGDMREGGNSKVSREFREYETKPYIKQGNDLAFTEFLTVVRNKSTPMEVSWTVPPFPCKLSK